MIGRRVSGLWFLVWGSAITLILRLSQTNTQALSGLFGNCLLFRGVHMPLFSSHTRIYRNLFSASLPTN